MGESFRFSVCNEVFQSLGFEETCSAIGQIGYAGIEIAPFTLAADPSTLTPADRRDIRQTVARHNLEFVGLHWLLVSPQGLHATTPDRAIRERTWEFLDHLVDLCSDLKTKNDRPAVLVFGSPKQRATTLGATHGEAMARMQEGLNRLAPHAEQRGVTILLEPLSSDQCDVVNTLEETVAILDRIASPAIQTMFDVHNSADELLCHPETLRRYWPHIRHIHVNEMDGQEPGRGNYNFGELLSTLAQLKYSGWVSLEAFDLTRDGREIAAGSLAHLKAVSARRSIQNI